MATLADEDFGWDVPEHDQVETEVSTPLVQVGADQFPVHPYPDNLTERGRAQHRRRWGQGEPITTPEFRRGLQPGELELYSAALERRLRYYAWSRVDTLGSGLVDPESLVQDALVERWSDDRDLDDADTERFAIRSIWAASSKLYRSAENRTEFPEDFDLEGPDFTTTVLSDAWRDRIETEFPESTAQALILVFEEQYTQSEAADTVGISRSTLTRAFATLRTWKGGI